MGFSCVPSLVGKVFPKKSPSTPSSSVNESDDDMKKQQEKRQRQEKQKQGAKKDEGKQKSNLHRAASTTPYFPFHSRPGLL